MSFPHYNQPDAMDCGHACLRIIARYSGKHYNNQTLRERCYLTREGVSLLGISYAAESISFHTKGATISFDQLQKDVQFTAIVQWNQNEIVVYDLFYHYHHSSLTRLVLKHTNPCFNIFCNILQKLLLKRQK
jgi:ATP-binding cassette subfamily B protein